MKWKCKVSREAFNSGSGSYIKEADFVKELDYRLNRVSGPSYLWLIKKMDDKHIYLSFQCSSCDTLEAFTERIKEDILPILGSLVVNGKAVGYNNAYAVQDAWIDRERWNPQDFVEPSGFMPI